MKEKKSVTLFIKLNILTLFYHKLFQESNDEEKEMAKKIIEVVSPGR